MSIFTKLLSKTLIQIRNYCSSPSSTLANASKTILKSKEKSREALSLIKSVTDPENILRICRAAALTPESSKLDHVSLSVAISKLAKSNYYEGIKVYLEELKDRPDLRNELFFSHSIVLYGQAGMIHNCISTFEQMEQRGVRRTVKSFNALLFSCILARKYDEVKRIFTEFPTLYNIEPDIDSYNTAIKALCKAGDSTSAYSILTEMEKNRCKPSVTTFCNLIAGFYKEEKFNDVGKVQKLMEQHGIKPGLDLYNVRIESLCKLGRSFEAKALLDGMLEREIMPSSDTYTSLIHGFCKEGKYEEAQKLFNSMVSHGCQRNSGCYFTLINFLCQGGDYESALVVCRESMEKSWFPNIKTMKALVKGLVSVSKVKEAKELVEASKKKFPSKADIWKDIEEKLGM